MTILGLHYAIWIVLILYFVGMLLMGWWSKRGAYSQEGYLLGNRQFGSLMMVMHAFGAGTHPGNVAGVMSEAVVSGVSSIWVSWMWLFGTPFYWLIAPVIRRMRCLTMADYFEQRFGKSASVLYIIVAAVGMIFSTILASASYILTRYILQCGRDVTIGVPILVGVAAGVIASLLTRPPKTETIEKFFKKIYVPIGAEKALELPLDEAVPASKRWLTAGGLFIVKPSRQSWVGFVVALAICLACVLVMLAILR